MANVRQLKDHGTPIFPITHVSLVKGMEYRALMDATYAWDGTGEPDVSKIPAGVVVTYDGTDYTGTLVASASTTGRFYLVPSTTVQGEWDRYMTDGSGSSYAWKAAGNTSIPSPAVVDNETTDDPTKSHSAAGGKRLKDQVDELDLKVDELVYDNAFTPTDVTSGGTLVNSDLYFDKDTTTIAASVASKQGYKLFYFPVTEGEVLNIKSIASPDHTIFNIGFAYSTPAAGVGVTGIIDLDSSNGINSYYVAPADGFVCVEVYYSYAINVKAYHLTNQVVKNKEDIQELKTSKQDVNNTTKGSFVEYSMFTENGYISATGELVSHAQYIATDFIGITPASSIKYHDLRSPGTAYPIIAYYDKNKTFLSLVNGSTSAMSGTELAPDGAEYVRFVAQNALSTFNPAVFISVVKEKEDYSFDLLGRIEEIYVRHRNICNENIWISAYVKDSSGLLADGAGYYYTSKMLKIKPGSKIYIFGVWSGSGVVSVAYYDADFAFLSASAVKGVQEYNRGKILTVPMDAVYARFVERDLTGSFRGYVKTISVEVYEPEYTEKNDELEGKVVAFFGDSITAGANVVPVTDGTVKPYPYLVADETGIFPVVGASPGGFYKYTNGSEYSIPSQVEICTMSPDIIVLEGGVNDYASGRTFGSVDYGSVDMYSDTLDDQSFCGGLEKTLRTCATRFPGIPIVYVIATKGRDYEWKANSAGQTYREYVDEILKVCKKYGVLVVNLHDESNLVPQMPQYYENETYTYTGDNLHPTTLSYKTFFVNRVVDALRRVLAVS